MPIANEKLIAQHLETVCSLLEQVKALFSGHGDLNDDQEFAEILCRSAKSTLDVAWELMKKK